MCMVNQYNYLGFTFILSRKKHAANDYLINKGRIASFSIQKTQQKLKG